MVSERALSTEERITAAYLHVVRKVTIMDLAIAFDVNMGRVSEAATAILLAAEAPKKFREIANHLPTG